jgi:hypothetical protein
VERAVFRFRFKGKVFGWRETDALQRHLDLGSDEPVVVADLELRCPKLGVPADARKQLVDRRHRMSRM